MAFFSCIQKAPATYCRVSKFCLNCSSWTLETYFESSVRELLSSTGQMPQSPAAVSGSRAVTWLATGW